MSNIWKYVSDIFYDKYILLRDTSKIIYEMIYEMIYEIQIETETSNEKYNNIAKKNNRSICIVFKNPYNIKNFVKENKYTNILKYLIIKKIIINNYQNEKCEQIIKDIDPNYNKNIKYVQLYPFTEQLSLYEISLYCYAIKKPLYIEAELSLDIFIIIDQ